MLRIVFSFSLFLISLFSFAQKKDTLIIIPLGGIAPQSIELTKPVSALSAGMHHISFLDSEGQLTTLVAPEAEYFYPPSFSDKLLAISTGDIHTVTLYTDSTLNQYFVNDGLSMFYPDKLRKIKEIASGPKMSVALTQKGILYCWGRSNTVKKLNIPIKTYGVKTASVGKEHIAFINIKDKVFVWGDHSLSQNKLPVFTAKPVKIANGDYHSVVLDATGKVYVWGNDLLGQTKIPAITEKVKLISAKNYRSMAITETNKVYIWGMNQSLDINSIGEIGKIKHASLGNNFAVLVVESTAEKIKQFARMPKSIIAPSVQLDMEKAMQELNAAIPDSLKEKLNLVSNDNLSDYLTENFSSIDRNNNTIEVENHNSSIEDNESSTNIKFEGSDNHIKIINEDFHLNRTNSKQRVIIKGSGKIATFYNSGDTTIVDDNSTIEIDLNDVGITSEYPEEYRDISSQPVDESFVIDLDNLPNSFINEFPIVDGQYYANGQFAGDISKKHLICEEAPFWSDAFEKARAYFFCKNIKEGINTLQEADDYFVDCRLALFEIYYYGLFGIKIDLAKANVYLTQYINGKRKYGMR